MRKTYFKIAAFGIVTILAVVLNNTDVRASGGTVASTEIKHSHTDSCKKKKTESCVVNTGNDTMACGEGMKTVHHYKCNKCGATWTSETHSGCGHSDSYGKPGNNCCTKTTESIKCGKTDSVVNHLSISSSETSLTNGNVTLTASADNGSLSWTSMEVSSNGTYEVTVKFSDSGVDREASISCSVSNIDKSAPSISISSSNTSLTNQDVTLTVTGSDENGLAEGAYSTDGSNFGGNNSITVGNNGTYSFWVKDAAGNVSQASFEVNNIDKSGPSVSLSASNTQTTTQPVTLTVTANDSSGLSGTPYQWNGGAASANNSIQVSENGTYSVTVYDSLGNSSSSSITVSNITKEEPKHEEPTVKENEKIVEEDKDKNKNDEEDSQKKEDINDNPVTEEQEPDSLRNEDDANKRIKSNNVDENTVMDNLDDFEQEKNEEETILPKRKNVFVEIMKNPEVAVPAAVTTSMGGGGFVFFFLFFAPINAAMYVWDGKKLKRIKGYTIKKKNGEYRLIISDRTLSKLPTNVIKIKFSKRFVKKHMNEICHVMVGNTETNILIQREVETTLPVEIKK